MCTMFFCACIHVVMVLLLKSAVEFMCEPGLCSGIWLFCLSMVYVAYSALLGERLSLTPRRLHAVRMAFIPVHVAAIFAISHGSKDTFLGQIGVIIASQVLHSVLFPGKCSNRLQFGAPHCPIHMGHSTGTWPQRLGHLVACVPRVLAGLCVQHDPFLAGADLAGMYRSIFPIARLGLLDSGLSADAEGDL